LRTGRLRTSVLYRNSRRFVQPPCLQKVKAMKRTFETANVDYRLLKIMRRCRIQSEPAARLVAEQAGLRFAGRIVDDAPSRFAIAKRGARQ
jgi:hypothetical protein